MLKLVKSLTCQPQSSITPVFQHCSQNSQAPYVQFATLLLNLLGTYTLGLLVVLFVLISEVLPLVTLCLRNSCRVHTFQNALVHLVDLSSQSGHHVSQLF